MVKLTNRLRGLKTCRVWRYRKFESARSLEIRGEIAKTEYTKERRNQKKRSRYKAEMREGVRTTNNDSGRSKHEGRRKSEGRAREKNMKRKATERFKAPSGKVGNRRQKMRLGAREPRNTKSLLLGLPEQPRQRQYAIRRGLGAETATGDPHESTTQRQGEPMSRPQGRSSRHPARHHE